MDLELGGFVDDPRYRHVAARNAVIVFSAGLSLPPPELQFSLVAWDGGAPAQINFILASQNWLLQDTWVDQHIHSRTDHIPIIAEVERKLSGKPAALEGTLPHTCFFLVWVQSH